MERTIDDRYLQLVKRETGQNTVLHCRLESLLDGRDVLLRYITTLHFVDKLQGTLKLRIGRLYAADDVGELTTTTGLFLIYLAQLNCLRDCLAVRYLRTTLVALYVELTLQTVDNNLQVQLTHTRDNGLTRLLVGLNGEGRILLSQLTQTDTQLVDVGLRLRLYRDTDYRCGEVNRLQRDLRTF